MKPESKNLSYDEQSRIIEELQLNFAFEQMIVAVLCGAALSFIFVLCLKMAAAAMAANISFAAFLTSFGAALLTGFLVFLAGFLATVLFLAPLLKALEKDRRRQPWPYFAVSLLIAAVGLVLVSALPWGNGMSAPVIASVILSAISIAGIYVRRMVPYWRARKEADEAAQSGPLTLH